MGEKGEGSGGEGGGKWGKRGRELGMGYPPVHPLINRYMFLQQQLWFQLVTVGISQPCTSFRLNVLCGWNCNINHIVV